MCQVHYHILSSGQPSTIGTTDIRTLKLEVGGNGSMFVQLRGWKQSLNSNWNMRSFRPSEAIRVCNHYATLVLLQKSTLWLEEVKLPAVAVGSTMPEFTGHPSFKFLAKSPFFPSSFPCHSGNWAEFRPCSEAHRGTSTAGKEILIFVCSHTTLKEIVFELKKLCFLEKCKVHNKTEQNI